MTDRYPIPAGAFEHEIEVKRTVDSTFKFIEPMILVVIWLSPWSSSSLLVNSPDAVILSDQVVGLLRESVRQRYAQYCN